MVAKKVTNGDLAKKPKKVVAGKVTKQNKPEKLKKKKIDNAVKKLESELKGQVKAKKPSKKPKTKAEKIKNGEKPGKTAAVKVKSPKKQKGKTSQIDNVKSDNLTEIRKDFSFLIEKLQIQPETIQTAIEGVLKTTANNPKLENQLFNEEFGIFLQINSFHISNQYPQILRLQLRNSLWKPDSEICLIVPDVQGIPNKEHEKHLEHYDELLRKHGIEKMFKKVMTFHEFRTEYETFEMKNRLVNLYDVFLVDGRISGKVVNKCGKIFYKNRKVPTAVKLQATKLKDHVNKALKKTQFSLHNKGNSFTVQIGHNQMSVEKLIENAYSALETLDQQFPGGFANVQNIVVNSHRGLTVPIYQSLKKVNEVKLPKKVMNKPKWAKTVRGELSTTLNKEVIVTPTGKVKVRQIKRQKNKTGAVTKATINPESGQITKKKVKKNKRKTNSNEATELVAQENGQVAQKKVKKNKAKSDVKKEATEQIAQENGPVTQEVVKSVNSDVKKEHVVPENGQVAKKKAKKNKRKSGSNAAIKDATEQVAQENGQVTQEIVKSVSSDVKNEAIEHVAPENGQVAKKNKRKSGSNAAIKDATEQVAQENGQVSQEIVKSVSSDVKNEAIEHVAPENGQVAKKKRKKNKRKSVNTDVKKEATEQQEAQEMNVKNKRKSDGKSDDNQVKKKKIKKSANQ